MRTIEDEREKVEKSVGGLSRRRFATGSLAAVTGALAATPAARAQDEEQGEGESGPDMSDLEPAEQQEVEARYKETLRRYEDRLTKEQKRRIKRVLVQNERMLKPIRAFTVENGDTPATKLELIGSDSAPEVTHGSAPGRGRKDA